MSHSGDTDADNGVTTAVSSEPAPRRRRLHKSTWVFAFLATVSMLLANIPGQVEIGPPAKIVSSWIVESATAVRCDHGWPITFLRRGFEPQATSISPFEAVWDLRKGTVGFAPIALAVNIAVSCGTIALGTWLFECWRRRRNRIWQLHLIDLLALVTVVAVMLGWWRYRVQQHSDDLDAAAQLSVCVDVHWHPGGWSWLRVLFGDPPINFPSSVGWPFERGNASIFSTFDEPGALLYMKNVFDYDPARHDSFLKTLPRLRRVRLLLLPHLGNAEWDCIARCSEVRAVQVLSSVELGDERTLRPQPTLRFLTLQGMRNDKLGFLTRLPNLLRLDLHAESLQTPLGQKAMANIVTATDLRDLSLTHLQSTSEGLRELLALERLEVLNVSGWTFSENATDILVKLTSLKRLDIHLSNFRVQDVAKLRRLLPNCEIQE